MTWTAALDEIADPIISLITLAVLACGVIRQRRLLRLVERLLRRRDERG
jgi:hypothetical protein